MAKHYKSSKGFTLVELSIVIIIIGFLIAGISAGTSLIKQAQLSSIITEADNFHLALITFHDRYQALPGDFANASSFWPGVVNGNGNVEIESITSPTGDESVLAWQHLNLAGLIPGNYTGTVTTPPTQEDIGINTPASKYPNGGYSLKWESFNEQPVAGLANRLYLGGFMSGDISYGALFTPADVQNIDSKIDDGVGGGKMWGRAGPLTSTSAWNDIGNCCSVNAWCADGDAYAVETNEKLCYMLFDFDLPPK